MSFTKVLAELPTLTFDQRQMLIRRVIELDNALLSPEDEALIEERLAAHRKSPNSAVSLDEMKTRLRSHLSK